MLDPSRCAAPDDEEDLESFVDRVRLARVHGIVDAEEEAPRTYFGPEWDELAPLLAKLPEVERVLLEGLRRGDSALRVRGYLGGLSNEAFVWRRERAFRALRLLRELPDWSPARVRDELLHAGASPRDAYILAVFWHCGCQSTTARLVACSQSHVSRKLSRHRSPGWAQRVDSRVARLVDALDLFARNAVLLRQKPKKGWQLPPGLTRIPRGSKVGVADLRGLTPKKRKGKRHRVPDTQLAFDFEALGYACG